MRLSRLGVRTVDWRRNVTCRHTKQLSTGRFQAEDDAIYLDHTAECLRSLKIIACLLKQRSRHVTTEPHLSIHVDLESLINAIDAVACFLDLKVPALQQSDT